MLLQRSARKIFEERNWSRFGRHLGRTCVDIQDQRLRRVWEQLGLHWRRRRKVYSKLTQ